MYYISRLIRSCDLSIYSFKKWQRLTRTFDDKKIEMQTTTKETYACGEGERGRGEIEGTMTRGGELKRKMERGVNSTSKRGKTEIRGRIVCLPHS